MLGRAYDKFSGRGFPWTWKGEVPMAGFGAARSRKSGSRKFAEEWSHRFLSSAAEDDIGI